MFSFYRLAFVASAGGYGFWASRQVDTCDTHIAPPRIRYSRLVIRLLSALGVMLSATAVLMNEDIGTIAQAIRGNDVALLLKHIPNSLIGALVATAVMRFLFIAYKNSVTKGMPLYEKVISILYELAFCISVCGMFIAFSYYHSLVLTDVAYSAAGVLMLLSPLLNMPLYLLGDKRMGRDFSWSYILSNLFSIASNLVLFGLVLTGVIVIGAPAFHTFVIMRTVLFLSVNLIIETIQAENSNTLPTQAPAEITNNAMTRDGRLLRSPISWAFFSKIAAAVGLTALSSLLVTGAFIFPHGLVGLVFEVVLFKFCAFYIGMGMLSYYCARENDKVDVHHMINNACAQDETVSELMRRDDSTYLTIQHALREHREMDEPTIRTVVSQHKTPAQCEPSHFYENYETSFNRIPVLSPVACALQEEVLGHELYDSCAILFWQCSGSAMKLFADTFLLNNFFGQQTPNVEQRSNDAFTVR